MLHSKYTTTCDVALPYAARQHYMHETRADDVTMPADCQDYVPIVDELLRSVGLKRGTVFVTIDEKVVERDATQRRPHPHVDGCYLPSRGSLNHPTPGAWAHGVRRMPIIVASSVARCAVYRGEFDAEPRNDGDLSHARHMLGDGEIIPAHIAALLSPDCVHESLPMRERCERTFLRIALPVDFCGAWS